MSVEFKVISGNTNVLLLINGKGIPAQVVQPKQRDSNELYRFLIRDDRLRELLPERTCRLVKHKRQVGGVVYERGDLYCSECDALLWDSCGDPFYSLSKEEQNYCYNCGAKVVE